MQDIDTLIDQFSCDTKYSVDDFKKLMTSDKFWLNLLNKTFPNWKPIQGLELKRVYFYWSNRIRVIIEDLNKLNNEVNHSFDSVLVPRTVEKLLENLTENWPQTLCFYEWDSSDVDYTNWESNLIKMRAKLPYTGPIPHPFREKEKKHIMLYLSEQTEDVLSLIEFLIQLEDFHVNCAFEQVFESNEIWRTETAEETEKRKLRMKEQRAQRHLEREMDRENEQAFLHDEFWSMKIKQLLLNVYAYEKDIDIEEFKVIFKIDNLNCGYVEGTIY